MYFADKKPKKMLYVFLPPVQLFDAHWHLDEVGKPPLNASLRFLTQTGILIELGQIPM